MEKIQEHLQLMAQHHAELEISQNALKQLGEAKVGTEVLASIADGIFIRADLKDNQKVIVNVGSNTTVERSIPEAIDLLKQQHESLVERIAETEKVLTEMNAQAMQIYQDVEKCQQDQKSRTKSSKSKNKPKESDN